MAISLKGKLADRAQKLLGGRNLTEKRVEGLLEEAEANRARIAELENLLAIWHTQPAAIASQGPRSPQDGELGGQAVPNLGKFADPDADEVGDEPAEDAALMRRHLEVQPPVSVAAELERMAPGDRLLGMHEAEKIASELRKEMMTPGKIVLMDPGKLTPGDRIRGIQVDAARQIGEETHAAILKAVPPPVLSPEMQMMQEMIGTLRALKEEVQAMKSLPTEDDKKEAIKTGKLPPPTATAPPAGLTGAASLPRGVWFTSPFTPPGVEIKMKLCDCPKCSPTRVHHYYCVSCRRGPLPYLGQTGPKGRKIYSAPGSVWGVAHECCSVTCWMRYLETLGVAPGINDHEPLNQPAPDEQPAMAPGSD